MLAKGLADHLPGERHDEATALLELVAEAARTVRALAHGLSPLDVDTDSLAAALHDLGDRCQSIFGVACSVEAEPCEMPRWAIAHLGMIAREAVANAVRHGRASTVRLVVASDGNRHTMSIEDDGIGMGSTRPRAGALGLVNMKRRAEAIGGALDVAARIPRGTVVRCSWSDHAALAAKVSRQVPSGISPRVSGDVSEDKWPDV